MNDGTRSGPPTRPRGHLIVVFALAVAVACLTLGEELAAIVRGDGVSDGLGVALVLLAAAAAPLWCQD